MIRYTLFLLAIAGTAATAIAAAQPGSADLRANRNNITVIEKNDVFPVLGPIIVEPCAVEDCSDVTS